MAAKVQAVDKRVSASPDQYNLPSKLVESPGKTMGMRLTGSLNSMGRLNVPGPGQYQVGALKSKDYKYSMGAKLKNASALAVPGPGTYDARAEAVIESVKSLKFGTG